MYSFITEEFAKSREMRSSLFEVVYFHFYRLTTPTITVEFIKKYFTILDEEKGKTVHNLTEIANQLVVEDSNGNETLYFSFATKLLHTIDNDQPIYDSKVAKVFSLTRPNHKNGFDNQIDIYKSQVDKIKNVYDKILDDNDNLIKDVLERFDSKYKHPNMSNIKKLDFLVWTLGKLQSKKQLKNPNTASA